MPQRNMAQLRAGCSQLSLRSYSARRSFGTTLRSGGLIGAHSATSQARQKLNLSPLRGAMPRCKRSYAGGWRSCRLSHETSRILLGIHVAGYQGWFDCPGDGAVGVGCGHWFRGGSDPQDPNSLAIDLWPDTSELDADERCPTAFHLPSGVPAFLFSDQNAKTVARHFAWVKQYGIDGAAMQRFLTNTASADLRQNFRYRSGQHSRGRRGQPPWLFVMYDIALRGGNTGYLFVMIKRRCLLTGSGPLFWKLIKLSNNGNRI
jgi:hypothetical protein